MPTPATGAGAADGSVETLPKLSLVKRSMKNRTSMRISRSAAVATGAAARYVLSEIIDNAHQAAENESKKKILPKHINNAISKDAKLAARGSGWILRTGTAAGSPARPGDSDQAAQKPAPEKTVTEAGSGRKNSAVLQAHQYRTFVKRLLKARQYVVSAASLTALSGIASQLVEEIAAETGTLATKANKQTIDADDVRAAIKTMLRGELEVHALAEIKDERLRDAPDTTAVKKGDTDAAAEKTQ